MKLHAPRLRTLFIYSVVYNSCVILDTQAYPNTKVRELRVVDSSNSSPFNYPERLSSVNKDIDGLIAYAIRHGDFLDRTEWDRQHANSKNRNRYQISDISKNDDHILKVKREPSGNDKVYFPVDNEEKQRSVYKPNASNCNGAKICNNATDYPRDVILEIMRRQNITLHSINDILPHEDDINERIAGDPHASTDLCSSSLELLQPSQGETINKEWLYIVNLNNRFNQSITVERCSEENKACSFIEINGYQTYCSQKFIYRELLALAPDGKRLRSEVFPIPASCCCSINLTGDTQSRMTMSSKVKAEK